MFEKMKDEVENAAKIRQDVGLMQKCPEQVKKCRLRGKAPKQREVAQVAYF